MKSRRVPGAGRSLWCRAKCFAGTCKPPPATRLGQLTDEHHSPFVGGVPLNVNGWNDLGNGGFSAQSDALLRNLYLVRQQQFYQCELSVKSMRDVVRYVGSIPCRELTFSALPDSVQHRAQLMLAGRNVPTGPTAMNAEHLTKGK